jgi:hypothetical protein
VPIDTTNGKPGLSIGVLPAKSFSGMNGFLKNRANSLCQKFWCETAPCRCSKGEPAFGAPIEVQSEECSTPAAQKLVEVHLTQLNCSSECSEDSNLFDGSSRKQFKRRRIHCTMEAGGRYYV